MIRKSTYIGVAPAAPRPLPINDYGRAVFVTAYAEALDRGAHEDAARAFAFRAVADGAFPARGVYGVVQQRRYWREATSRVVEALKALVSSAVKGEGR